MIFSRGVRAKYIFPAVATAATLIPLHTAIAGADDNAFYPKNAALTIFSNEIVENSNTNYKILNQAKKEKDLEVGAGAKLQDPAQAAQAPEVKSVEPVSVTSEAVLAKFGDPNKDAPIPVQSTAPVPFQAMMAALDAGDDKLAYAYARQYARHLRNLQQRNEYATGLQGKALQAEGMLPEGSWADNPQYDAISAAISDEIDKTKTPNSSLPVDISKVDAKTKAILEQAFAEEEAKIEQAKANASLHQQLDKQENAGKEAAEMLSPSKKEAQAIKQERQNARVSFVGKVPVDPKGEVEIYFFLRSKEEKSKLMGRELQALYEKVRHTPNITMRGLTLDLEQPSEVAVYRAYVGATFPIANGTKFAEMLGIKNAPAIVFVSKNSKKAFMETGLRKGWYLEELVKHMIGGSK